MDTVDSGKAQREDLHAFKNSTDQTEELLESCEALVKKMEDSHSNDKEERLFEKLRDQYSEYQENYQGMKPSIDRVLSNKKIMRILE